MSTGINIVPPSGITVGTTAVTSGTDGRVFFQAGGVVQQDGAFNWDNTNKRLGIGANATSPTSALFLRTNTLVANDIVTIQNGQYGNNIFRIRDNVTTSQSTIGSIFVQARIYGSGSTITGNEFDLGGYGLGASYGDGAANAVWLNNQGNVGDGVGSSVISVSSNFYVNLQTTKKYKFEAVTGNFGIGNVGTLGARLDVRAQGALSTDIAFRVRNSADTADLISFRGDGSQWIQSVPFIHAGSLTGTTNATQSLHIGYNAAALNSASSNSITIGRGTGASLAGNNNVSIGNANSIGGFSSMLGIGLGVQMIAANTAYIGSETFPYSTMWVSTGGEVSSGANLRGLDFRVSGCVGGLTNQSASGVQVRFFSPNGTGSGAGSNIQFHVAPSNTGGSAFNRNIFSEMFTIRGEADGLNHYQLSTPRVPSASITDGYIQYSNDITAGNAAPHFRTENGAIVKVYQETTGVGASTLVTGVGTPLTDTDTFDGYTLKQIVKALRNQGLLA